MKLNVWYSAEDLGNDPGVRGAPPLSTILVQLSNIKSVGRWWARVVSEGGGGGDGRFEGIAWRGRVLASVSAEVVVAGSVGNWRVASLKNVPAGVVALPVEVLIRTPKSMHLDDTNASGDKKAVVRFGEGEEREIPFEMATELMKRLAE